MPPAPAAPHAALPAALPAALHAAARAAARATVRAVPLSSDGATSDASETLVLAGAGWAGGWEDATGPRVFTVQLTDAAGEPDAPEGAPWAGRVQPVARLAGSSAPFVPINYTLRCLDGMAAAAPEAVGPVGGVPALLHVEAFGLDVALRHERHRGALTVRALCT